MKAFSLGVGSGVQNIWRRYERQLERRPVLTQMTTSCLLWATGDALAQRLVERRKLHEMDARRVAATAVFGACFMGPVGHFWYSGLDATVARFLTPGTAAFIGTKILADTLIMGPAYVILFYAWGCAAIDGSGVEGFKKKITQDFIPTYTAELAIWPLFQALNFSRVPVEHQLLAVNAMTLLDAAFLSWARNQEDWVATATAKFKAWQGGNAKPAAA
ncbi:hypothetical protein HYH03_012526 [Edaphochlamys debaryana]|uniref:Uncharacterized protein n=1 Tax=Edaphochlamys debaryana TaxID=47281 RepID=A0A835XRS0_9CHLO|nr:hypothetical protein HYH03_012526 [Edaphochlamys debaryana]|eukprot:KAG2488896.1 hypothetical protein HYH03_012526 [Edaphochlamys debaryana]